MSDIERLLRGEAGELSGSELEAWRQELAADPEAAGLVDWLSALRACAAGAPLGGAPAEGAECPDALELAGLAEGGLDAGRRDAVLAHAAGCPPCQDGLAAALEELAAAASGRAAPADAGEFLRDVARELAPTAAAAAGAPLRVPAPRAERPGAGSATPLRPVHQPDADSDADPGPAARDVDPLESSRIHRVRPTWGAARILSLAASVLFIGLLAQQAWLGDTPAYASLVSLERLPVRFTRSVPEAGSPEAALLEALQAYDAGEWDVAEPLLAQAAPALSTRRPEVHLYHASTLLQLGRPEEAVTAALAAESTEALRAEALWLAAQGRLLEDPADPDGARRLLGLIVDEALEREPEARELRAAIDAM